MPKTFHRTSTVRDLRLDLFLAQRLPELSRSYVKKLIDDAATAPALFGDDELEEYADEKIRKAKAAMRKVPVEGEH